MGNKNKRRLDEAAGKWFDQTNDDQPFDAFGSTARKTQIGEELYERIWNNIQQKKKISTFYIKIAAAVLIIAATGFGIFQYAQHTAGRKAQLVWTEIHTDHNDYKKITLPDSSVIRMNAASEVRFLSAFDHPAERNIYLNEGYAFFDVSKDAARPFTVYVKGFRVRVLGTAFSISAYKGQPDMKVEVTSGSIKVEQELSSGEVKILAEEMTKDQRLTVNLATTQYKIEKQATGKTVQLTMPQIAKELGNRFNLFVQLNNPENDTSTYAVNLEARSLNEILQTLSEQTGFNYTIVNKQHLIIKPKS